MALFENRYKTHDLGLLILRVGIGVMFTIHGYPKLIGGPEAWAKVGSTMKLVGLDFAPAFWGLLAAIAEAVGGQLLAIGLFFRLACALLLGTMLMATIQHVSSGDGFQVYSHALEAAFLFMGLLFAGPGRYSLDQVLFPARRRLY
ncbi:DoxX family protein [Hymenobacter taeanensis]|uniref:DoxX family protein n=1 Tax=Hymenobacter taeanensis TaxID=2735321 RepID=A0A6M6BN19_9BACT|nr:MULTISPECIES: DoxX family protein [Hymenobacter]QJX48475.1 DoxX family protein [Hymenobacter taeanensis]UOQ82030.1 DoxX family protein [Hymenobacter sp. 5414T-23]